MMITYGNMKEQHIMHIQHNNQTQNLYIDSGVKKIDITSTQQVKKKKIMS